MKNLYSFPLALLNKFDYACKLFSIYIQINKPAAQTLTDANPPIDKIHPLSKIAVTLEPIMQF